MNTYVVGDVQGCADELQRLLDAVRFSPGRDSLILLGDLINRGPRSVETLRLARSLGTDCQALLGNHDLSILARLSMADHGRPLNATALDIAQAHDGDALREWLRQLPLAIDHPKALMIHAGLAPQWTRSDTLRLAGEVERALRSDTHAEFLRQMYGDEPHNWNEELSGYARLRFITNCLTRLRYCTADGKLALSEKMSPEETQSSAQKTLLPWFAVPHRASADTRILFGHWSTLGQVYWPAFRVWGLDTGCVWGGRLTALHLETWRLIQAPSDGHKKPGGG